jgi:cytochrome P450
MSERTTVAFKATRLPRNTTAPGPHGFGLPGSVYDFRRDPLRSASAMTKRYGDVVRLHFLSWDSYLVNHPDGVKHVLQENQQNYSKDIYMLRFLKTLLGQGLLTNDGASWLHQRRLMQPAFHRKRLAFLGTLMTENTVAMLECWQHFVEGDQPLDVADEMTRLTLHIVGQALFHIDLSAEADSISQAFTTFRTQFLEYISAPHLPLGVPTPRNRRMRTVYRTLDGVVRDIIQQHRTLPIDTDSDVRDVLSMLLLARDEETGQSMNDQQVRDEVMTLLLAGHETTATALAWTWYFLSQYPEVERCLHTELDMVLGGHLPTVERLPELHYTNMVLEEVLRLYPPTFGLGRKAIADDEIGGYVIPANSMVLLCPYTTHRHPAFWEHPEVFDPERFAAKQEASRPRYAYFPFGGGPRMCIGNAFAFMEMQLVLATVAQRYQLRLVPGHAVEPMLSFTLRPRHGLPMMLLERA